jgi:putative sigma-54 modulation protein
MNYTENFEGIKMDVQAVGVNIGNTLQLRVRKMIARLRRHISEVNWVDVHFKREGGNPTGNRILSIRLGIPGNDVFASGSGDSWMVLLKNVEEKLRRQLEKR